MSLGLDQWFLTLGLFAFFVGSQEVLIKLFMILYFVYGTTFYHRQNNRITWQK